MAWFIYNECVKLRLFNTMGHNTVGRQWISKTGDISGKCFARHCVVGMVGIMLLPGILCNVRDRKQR